MAPDVGKSGQQQNQDENKKKHVWLLQFGPRVIARDVLRIATQIGDEWNSRDQQLERATQPSGARNKGVLCPQESRPRPRASGQLDAAMHQRSFALSE